MNILVLHKIVENKPKEWSEVNLVFFKNLLNNIIHNNLKLTSLSEWKKNNIGDIVLTFDDGLISDYELVYPLLRKMNLKATFFIVADFVGKSGYLNWDNIKEMSNSGMEIASHSSSHKYMTNLEVSQIKYELEISKIKIEKEIGKEIDSFAYPYGDCSNKLNRFAFEAGYKYICNSRPGLNDLNSSILSRNSIHSNIRSSDINRVLFPKQYEIAFQKIGYEARSILKKSLGVNNYLKLRELIY